MKVVWLQRGDGAFEKVEAAISARIWGAPCQMAGDTALTVVSPQGEALAGVVYQNYDPEAGVIELSGAATSPRFLTRGVLFEIYDYPFNQLGCQAVLQVTRADDWRQDRMLRAYGFRKHVIPRLRGRDKDGAIFILYDDVWRTNGFHGKD